jgi:hypothetical protein
MASFHHISSSLRFTARWPLDAGEVSPQHGATRQVLKAQLRMRLEAILKPVVR